MARFSSQGEGFKWFGEGNCYWKLVRLRLSAHPGCLHPVNPAAGHAEGTGVEECHADGGSDKGDLQHPCI